VGKRIEEREWERMAHEIKKRKIIDERK